MELSIIIVNWNSVAYLKDCLRSVLANPPEVEYEIVVVDSASFDGCAQMLQESYPFVRFVQSAYNLGFGRANNLAVEASSGNYLLFLNPDTVVLGAAIMTMYASLRRLPAAGLVGCRLLNSDHSLQTSCVQAFPTVLNQIFDAEWLRRRWPSARLWGTAALYANDARSHRVEMISGACVMMCRDVFLRVGLFSSEYFMYAEDTDLCYKVKVAGLENYYVPEATIIHHGGGSSREAPSDFSVVMMRESILLFLRKSRGRAYGLLYRVAMCFSALFRLMYLLPRRAIYAGSQGRLDAQADSWRKWRAVLSWSIFRRAAVGRYGLPT